MAPTRRLPFQGRFAQPASYTALVVEDEDMIREIAVQTLEDDGFAVLEAEHAASALIHLNVSASSIHVLFTDLHMPGEMDGLALAHHANLSWPWIALLLASGQRSPTSHEMPPGCRFIPKPYHPNHMLTHVRELVGVA
jgi:DNA-binding NtrC family response regulator